LTVGSLASTKNVGPAILTGWTFSSGFVAVTEVCIGGPVVAVKNEGIVLRQHGENHVFPYSTLFQLNQFVSIEIECASPVTDNGDDGLLLEARTNKFHYGGIR
jgi:hypothetical protein